MIRLPLNAEQYADIIRTICQVYLTKFYQHTGPKKVTIGGYCECQWATSRADRILHKLYVVLSLRSVYTMLS